MKLADDASNVDWSFHTLGVARLLYKHYDAKEERLH
jgi:hypothetical protein